VNASFIIVTGTTELLFSKYDVCDSQKIVWKRLVKLIFIVCVQECEANGEILVGQTRLFKFEEDNEGI